MLESSFQIGPVQLLFTLADVVARHLEEEVDWVCLQRKKKKKNISKKKKLSLPTSEVLGDVEPPKPQHPTDNLCLYIHICVAKGS